MKRFLKSYAYLFGGIILLTLLLSILNYFIKLPSNMIKVIIPIISILCSSIILGKNSNNKAYLEGIKFALIYIIFTFLFSVLIIKTKINLNILLYYLILVLTSMFGSMLGINLKKK